MTGQRLKKGFTLGELLIVVAIIAVLTAIAIPVFYSQLEKSRQSVDLASMRSAYAAAIYEWPHGGGEDQEITYYYDGVGITTDPTGITGYGKSRADAAEFGEPLTFDVTGVPNQNGKANYLTIVMNKDGTMKSMTWGTRYVTFQSDTWWNHSAEREAAYNEVKSIPNATRVESDKRILKSLASYFDGLSEEEAKKILGNTRYNKLTSRTGNDDVLFEYCKDNGGSIRISNLDESYTPYFNAIGYTPKISMESTKETNYTAHKNNYTNQFLFTSDETIGQVYRNQGSTSNQIKIKFNIKDGVVTDTKIWLKDHSEISSDP